MEQQAFVTWSRAKLIVDIDILQAKQKFTSLVELFLQERSTEFPLYPRPEMPDATIEAIVDARVYLVANNSGKNHTAKFRVFTDQIPAKTDENRSLSRKSKILTVRVLLFFTIGKSDAMNF